VKWYGYILYLGLSIVIPYTVTQWQFWVWAIVLNVLIIARDEAIENGKARKRLTGGPQ